MSSAVSVSPLLPTPVLMTTVISPDQARAEALLLLTKSLDLVNSSIDLGQSQAVNVACDNPDLSRTLGNITSTDWVTL